MKKSTILLIFWILAITAYSQIYHKVIQTNKYWDIYSLNFICYDSIDKTYFTGTDTIIEGHSYNISYKYSYLPVNPGYLKPPFVIDTISIPTNRYLREDTIAKQVFIYMPGYPVSDQLLFDFSLNIGDTLKSEFNAVWGGYLIVTSIDSVTLLNGEIRKRFILKDLTLPAFPGFYIEGIGGSQGLFKPIIANPDPLESKYGYLCVSKDDIDLWGDQCDWYFVGTQNLTEQAKIRIYPNPVHEKVIVELPTQTSAVLFNLYATNGKLVKTIRLNSPKCEICLIGISPGIYIVQITSESIIYNGKLAISN